MTQASGAKDSVSAIRQASLDIREAMPVENIERFLRHYSGEDKIAVSDIKVPDATGVSSGGLFLTAEIGDIAPDRLFLKFDTQAPVRPFHIYDLAGQFAVQKALFENGAPVPEPLYLDSGGTYLGRPGFIMKVISGQAGSSKAWCEGALATAEPARRESMLAHAIEQMARMHTMDVDQPELKFLSCLAKGTSSIEREINWTLDLAAYHQFSDPRIDAAAKALAATMPSHWTDTFNHGDNKFDNYLFSDGKVAAIIDFEMSTIAPRELDLAYLLFTTRMLTPPDNPKPDWFPDSSALIRAYENASGYKVRDFDFYEDLIALKFSVMVLAFTSRLGLLSQAPEMFTGYWRAIEAVASKNK